jgi:reversibly glycosylated polypeptide/UDP-arabinopyranose mutase
VREGLGHIDDYFLKVADGMLAWCACWRQLNPQHA